MAILENGTGNGDAAKVGNKNRLHTHSLSASILNIATMNGEAFNVSSQLVNLTSATESALLYIENRENKDISLINEFVNLGTSTGGVGKGSMKFYLVPTGGTLITNALEADVDNRRIGDSLTLTATTYRGVEGDTLTGGSVIEIPTAGGQIASEYIIPKGASFAISYTPPVGNTSMNVQIGFLIIKDYPNYTID